MTTNDLTSARIRALKKVRFLEEQLESLNHYLPETYEYLMKELDHRKRIFTELDVQESFSSIDSEQEVDNASL